MGGGSRPRADVCAACVAPRPPVRSGFRKVTAKGPSSRQIQTLWLSSRKTPSSRQDVSRDEAAEEAS